MSDTTEWLVPKIEGVHMVSRPGDTVALQFPAGSEDVVLEILEEWVAALRSGESTTGEPPDQDSPPDLSDLPDLDPRMQQPAGRPQKRQLVRMNHKPRSAGTTRGDTVSANAAPAQNPAAQAAQQDPLALALGTSSGRRQGKPLLPKGPLPTRTRIGSAHGAQEGHRRARSAQGSAADPGADRRLEQAAAGGSGDLPAAPPDAQADRSASHARDGDDDFGATDA